MLNYRIKVEKNPLVHFRLEYDILADIYIIKGQYKVDMVFHDMIIENHKIENFNKETLGEIILEMYPKVLEVVEKCKNIEREMQNFETVEIILPDSKK